MQWIINDNSLSNQYLSKEDFFRDISQLIELKTKVPLLNQRLYCSRTIGNRLVFNNECFSSLILKQANKNIKQQVLSWISKRGPFWDDIRTEQNDDYYEHRDTDVTDAGLGECARMICAGKEVSSYSFNGDYNRTPLTIHHGIDGDRLGEYPIDNLWDIQQLKNSIEQAQPEPKSWEEVLIDLARRFSSLNFSDNILNVLKPQPFSTCVYNRLLQLCDVLQEILDCRNTDGTYSQRTNELIAQHFSGNKAWFTDESETNKQAFKEALTFKHSDDPNELFCSFHGKIKTPQFRMHFDWPIKADSNEILIVYIGPKITKG